MLGGVREGLRDHEVGRALDRRGEAAARVRLDRRSHAVAGGERVHCGHEAAVGEQRRDDATCEVAQLGNGLVGLALGVLDQPADLRLIVRAQLRAAPS